MEITQSLNWLTQGIRDKGGPKVQFIVLAHGVINAKHRFGHSIR